MKQGSRALVAFAILLAVCWLPDFPKMPIFEFCFSKLGKTITLRIRQTR